MAANGNSSKYSLKDVVAYKDPSGGLLPIAEVMTKVNPFLDHIPFKESTLEAGEIVARRKQLGSPSWRRYNEGVQPSVTKVSTATEIMGHLEDWSEIDKALVDIQGDQAEFQFNESKGKMESMAQEMAVTYMYGNLSSDPKTFTGFMPRLGALNSTYGTGSPIVIDGGGRTATAQGSILIVGWGMDKVYGIYPKNTVGGLQFENLGEDTKTFTDGSLMRVYRSRFGWDAGLAIKDYRYVIRIANIDAAALATIGTDSDTSAILFNKIMDALAYIPIPGSVDLHMYMPRPVWSALNKKSTEISYRDITMNIQDAGFVYNVYGVPCHLCDSMLMTEAVVS
jgi:hypothetical protein